VTCDCYQKINSELAAHNTKIASYFTLDESRVGRPWPIETVQLEKGRGKPKAMGLFASYCPICGKSLRGEQANSHGAGVSGG